MAFNNAITALGRILKRKGSPDDDSGGGQENNDRAATKKFCSSSSSLAAAALRDISAPSIDHFLTCGLDGNRRRQHPNDAIEEQGSRWIKQIQRFDFSLSSSLTPPSAPGGEDQSEVDFNSSNDDWSSTADHDDRVLSLPGFIPIRSDAERKAAAAAASHSNEGIVSFTVNQNVSYDQLSDEYIGVTKLHYPPPRLSFFFQTELQVKSFRHAFRSVVAADAALFCDIGKMWKEGRGITAFVSLAHFLACRKRDVALARSKHPSIEIPSLEQALQDFKRRMEAWRRQESSSSVEYPYSKVTQCLSSTFIGNLWTLQPSRRHPWHPMGDVRETYPVLSELFHNADINNLRAGNLVRGEFTMTGSDATRRKKRLHSSRVIARGCQRDFSAAYGTTIDLNDPSTYGIDFEGHLYEPLQYKEDETDSSYFPGDILRAIEDKIARCKEYAQEFIDDERFIEGDESAEGRYYSVEDYEEEEVAITQSQHQQFDRRLNYLETHTPLSTAFFEKAGRGKYSFAQLISTITESLPAINQELGTNITIEQILTFDEQQYNSTDDKRGIVSSMVDALDMRLAPNNKCRFAYCSKRPSDHDDPKALCRAFNQDHTGVGVEKHGKKANAPSEIRNIKAKRQEKKKGLPTCRECHDVYDPAKRTYEKPLSRKARQLIFRKCVTHRSGRDVILSRPYMGLFMDLLKRQAFTAPPGPPPFSSRVFNALTFLHVGMPLTMLTTDPIYLWDGEMSGKERMYFASTVLGTAAKRLSEACANPDCPTPDVVDLPTWFLHAREWDHEGGKGKDISKLNSHHPIHLLNEILRWCAVTCCACHGKKTALNNRGISGRVYS